MNKRIALQVVLWMICLYHVFLGVCGFLSEELAARLADIVFSIKLEPTPQISYLAKLLGIYAVVFGLMTAIAALAPERHPMLLKLVILLYVLRVLNKVVFSALFAQAFAVPAARTWIDIAMLCAFGLAVAFLRPRPTVAGGV
jgi:hypothetical protein